MNPYLPAVGAAPEPSWQNINTQASTANGFKDPDTQLSPETLTKVVELCAPTAILCYTNPTTSEELYIGKIGKKEDPKSINWGLLCSPARKDGQTEPYIAIQAKLYRDFDTNQKKPEVEYFHQAGTSATHKIRIKFLPNTFHMRMSKVTPVQRQRLAQKDVTAVGESLPQNLIKIQFKIISEPHIEGYPWPYQGSTHLQNIMQDKVPVAGNMFLKNLVMKPLFEVILVDYASSIRSIRTMGNIFYQSGNIIPYTNFRVANPQSKFATRLDWDMKRFERAIPQCQAQVPNPYQEMFYFNRFGDWGITATQAIVQDIFDVMLDAETIRDKKLNAIFVHVYPDAKTNEKKESEYWVILKHDFNQKFPHTVNLLLALGEEVRLCFDPKPKKGAKEEVQGKKKKLKDNKYWEGYVVRAPFDHPGNLVIKVRRPLNPATPSYIALHKKRIVTMKQSELTTDTSKLLFTPVYLKLVEGQKVAKRKVAAVNRISPPNIKLHKSKSKKFWRHHDSESSEGSFDQEFSDEDYSVDECSDADYDTDADVENDPDIIAIRSTVATLGSGSASDPDRNKWQRIVMQGGQISCQTPSLPIVSFIKGVNEDWQMAVRANLTKRQETRLGNVLHGVPLGLLPIIDMPGGGKSSLLAALAMLCLGSSEKDRLICCTPTHAAANALVTKLEVASIKTLSNFNKGKLEVKRRPLIIRAHNERAEVEAVLYIVKNNGIIPGSDSNPWSSMFWGMGHSFAEWFLKVMNYQGYRLDPVNDSKKLIQLQLDLSRDPAYDDVRKFLGGTTLKELKEKRADEERFPSVPAQIKRTMLQISFVADIVVSTAYGSLDTLVKNFNKNIAKVTIIDEAGAMTQAEGMIAWRDSRPLIIAGDPFQLLPAVMSKHRQKEIMVNGTSKSVFAHTFNQYASLSFLEKIRCTAWPCFILDEQLRICNGGFNLAKELNYNKLKVQYTDLTQLSNNPRYQYVTKIDSFLKELDRNVTPSPAGMLSPVFIHCGGTVCQKTPEMSRYNPGQAKKLFALMEKIGKGLRIQPKDMLVIVPYRAMQSYLRTQLGQLPPSQAPLADVIVATSDSFQGNEAPVTFFVMTVTKESGPGFLTDSRRLNVSSTRHTEMFFVIGDVDTVTSPTAKALQASDMEEGQFLSTATSRNQDLFNFLGWFKKKGRVIRKF
ncbi:hypothetical protein B7463_g10861, partial [Scytalidium lignicola]